MNKELFFVGFLTLLTLESNRASVFSEPKMAGPSGRSVQMHKTSAFSQKDSFRVDGG